MVNKDSLLSHNSSPRRLANARTSAGSLRLAFVAMAAITPSGHCLVSDYGPNLSDLTPNLFRDIGNNGCANIGFDYG